MNNYVDFKNFKYQIKDGNILDAIMKGYVKYYIDEGLLKHTSEESIVSIVESSLYTLVDFLDNVFKPNVEVQYKNSAVGTEHSIKYVIFDDNIEIDTNMPIKMLDPVDLRVKGLLKEKDLFIPLTPEVQELVASDNFYDVAESYVNSALGAIIDVVGDNKEERERLNKLFGLTQMIYTFSEEVNDNVIDIDKFVTYTVGNIIKEFEVLGEETHDESEDESIVGRVNIIKEIRVSQDQSQGEQDRRIYTKEEGGVLGEVLDMCALNYLNIEKEYKHIFTKPKLSDALNVAVCAIDIFWDFIDDLTREGLVVPDDIKFNLTTTLMDNEYSSLFIEFDGCGETNEYKFTEEALYGTEEEKFERICDCVSSTANQFDYEGDEEYDTLMLKKLGCYIGSDFNYPVIDFLEDVRQRIIKVQDYIKSLTK